MEHAAIAPRSMSGKRATIIMLVILLSTGGLFYWVTQAYSGYNAARRQTERHWRELASELDLRYRALDNLVATDATAQQLDSAIQQRWQATREAFSGTTLSRNQIQSARQLEELIAQMPKSIQDAAAISSQLSTALAQYDESAQKQRQIGRQVGSQLLKTMLNLPDPEDLRLSASPDGR